MRKIILPVLMLIFSASFAQVGINNDVPKATLDIKGTPENATKMDGVIIPKITGNQLRAKTYTTDQTSALIYVTTADTAPAGQTVDVLTPGYYYFSGSKWIALASDWSLNGNAGTDATKNFLGTKDNQDLIFKRNNVNSAWLGENSTANYTKNNTSFGTNALKPSATNTGSSNTAFGSNSLSKNTTGNLNVAHGVNALRENTTGSWNIAVGTDALRLNTTGAGNTAVGNLTTARNTIGSNNVAVGENSLNRNTEGNGNTVVGTKALIYNTTGNNNTVLGYNVGHNSADTFTGSNNVLIGHNAFAVDRAGNGQLNIAKIIYGTGTGLNDEEGNIGIGVKAPMSKFEVKGAITNSSATTYTGSNIDFSLSNLAYTTANAGAITLSKMKDGGVYKLLVKGATSGTATFTATDSTLPTEGVLTVKIANNRSTEADTATMYTFVVMGTTVYVDIITGYPL